MPPSRARRYMGQLVTSMPPSMTLPALGSISAAGHAEAGGLAGAVGAQQADDLAWVDLEIDAVHDAAAAVDLHQSLGFQHRHGGSSVNCGRVVLCWCVWETRLRERGR